MMTKRIISLFALSVTLIVGGMLPTAPISADPGATACTSGAQSNLPGCSGKPVYGAEMRAIMAEMGVNPAPDFAHLPIDENVIYQRAFRRVLEPTPIYDAPNGAVIGQFPAGFIFIEALRGVEGWAMIGPNQFVPEAALGPINKAVSKFSGFMLPDGLPTRPFAWMLLDTKPSRTPGAAPVKSTPDLKRYTPVNIFAVAIVDTWEWYLVGPDQWVLQTRVAKAKPVARPEGITTENKWFAVDLYEQTLTAYQGDKAVFVTLIASGLEQWGTDQGVFRIFDRHEAVRMSGAAGKPEYWNLPLVPYVMYFNTSEQALHGAYWHDGFGYRRSRGCINLTITDAKWIYEWAADATDAYVYVFHSAEYRAGAPQ